jgi:hypothetical protein
MSPPPLKKLTMLLPITKNQVKVESFSNFKGRTFVSNLKEIRWVDMETDRKTHPPLHTLFFFKSWVVLPYFAQLT